MKQQFLVGFIGGLSLLSGGASFMWLVPLAHPLQKKNDIIHLTSEDVAWLFALFGIGQVVTPVTAAYAADRWGRKPLLLAYGPSIAVTWVALILSRTKLTFYIVRTVQGMLTAVPYTILPVYLAEISEYEFRGTVTSFFCLMWQMGTLYAYIVGSFLSYKICTYAMLLPPALFTITFLWCPETPYCLVKFQRKKSATKVLALIRGCRVNSECVALELREIEATLLAELQTTNGSWRDLFTTRVGLKALSLSQFVTMTFILTGVPFMKQYVTTTVIDVSGSVWIANAVSMILGLAFLLVSIPSSVLVDSLGRRPVLLISLGGCALSLVVAGVALCLLELSRDPQSYSYYAILRSLPSEILARIQYGADVIAMCFVTFGIESVVPVLQTELFTGRTRTVASSMTTMSVVLFDAASAQLSKNVDLPIVYLVRFCFSLVGCLVVYCFVPETKKKTFEEIQKIL